MASVPLLSSAIHVGTKAAGTSWINWTMLSSLLCVIVFAATFTLRGFLGAAPKSDKPWIRTLPGVASLIVVGLAVWQIAQFSSAEKNHELALAEQQQKKNGTGSPGGTPAGAPTAKPGGTGPATTPANPTGGSGMGTTGGPGAASNPAGGSGQLLAVGGTGQSVGSASGGTGQLAAAPGTTPGTPPGTTEAGASPPGVPYDLSRQVVLFLMIYPTLIFALGMILVTNFTQQTARDIQSLVEQSLPNQAQALYNRIKLISSFYEIGRQPGQERFLKIGEALIEDRNEILEKLSVGMIELGGADAVRMQQSLVQTFMKSFDAVSCRDLKFWVDIGGDELSRNYFRLNLEALKRSNKVTRLLIFDDNEVARTADVVKALEHHHRFGIGWAVVPYMDLDPSTREEDDTVALDFGLYDESEVAIYFRDYQSGSRKLRAIFPGPKQQDFLARQRQRYADLLAQCWLVSSSFLDRLNKLPAEVRAAVKYAAIRNSLVTARELELPELATKFEGLLHFTVADLEAAGTLDIKDCYLFPNSEADIPGNVELMYKLRSKCRDWTGPRLVTEVTPPQPPPSGATGAAAGKV